VRGTNFISYSLLFSCNGDSKVLLQSIDGCFAAEGRLSAANAAADIHNLGLSVSARYVEIVCIEANVQVIGRKILQRKARHALGAEFASQASWA
jgi:hypothetical protein